MLLDCFPQKLYQALPVVPEHASFPTSMPAPAFGSFFGTCQIQMKTGVLFFLLHQMPFVALRLFAFPLVELSVHILYSFLFVSL